MTEKDQIIVLHVIPKSSRNELVGWVDGADGGKALKIKVTTAPEDGRANKAVIALLANAWDCAPAEMELVSGHAARHKRLKILSPALYRRVMATLS